MPVKLPQLSTLPEAQDEAQPGLKQTQGGLAHGIDQLLLARSHDICPPQQQPGKVLAALRKEPEQNGRVSLQQVLEPILDDPVALAGRSLQAPAVADREAPIVIVDQVLLLQDAYSLGDPRVADTQHSCDVPLGEGKLV